MKLDKSKIILRFKDINAKITINYTSTNQPHPVVALSSHLTRSSLTNIVRRL